MMHDYLGLPTDVILMLLQYTVSIGKSNMRYIEKTAIGWADEEINTHEKAEEKIRRLNERAQAWDVVEQTLGITHRSPTRNETELSTRWVQGVALFSRSHPGKPMSGASIRQAK